jgi:hypothetical protein
MTKSPEYQAYRNARHRCENPNAQAYANYGGRGIKFLFETFEEFLADVGFRPSAYYSLERKENNGHYAPGNVKWATWSEQQRNKRKVTILNRKGKGYTWNKQAKKWVAFIYYDGKAHYLGRFDTEAEAAQVYMKEKNAFRTQKSKRSSS